MVGFNYELVFARNLVKKRFHNAMVQGFLATTFQAHQVVVGFFAGNLINRMPANLSGNNQT